MNEEFHAQQIKNFSETKLLTPAYDKMLYYTEFRALT